MQSVSRIRLRCFGSNRPMHFQLFTRDIRRHPGLRFAAIHSL